MTPRTITLAPDVPAFSAEELLLRFVNTMAWRYRLKKRPRLPFWAEVREATALGSNCSAGLARWAGLDPDTAAELPKNNAASPAAG